MSMTVMKQEGRVGSNSALCRIVLVIPLLIALYALALHAVYTGIVIEAFKYVGFRYESPTTVSVVAAWVMATLCCVSLPRKLARPSAVVLWVIFVVAVAPFLLMSPYLGIIDSNYALLSGLGISAVFTVVCRLTTLGAASAWRAWRRPSSLAFWLFIIAFSVVSYGWLAATQGISLKLLAFADVYDVRDEYAEALAGSRLMGYLVVTQANAVNPLLIAVSWYSRRRALLVTVVAAQLLLYFSTGFKSIAFSLIAIVVLGALFRRNRRPDGLALVLGAAGLVVVAWWIDLLQGASLWTSLFARRFLIIPARLTDMYLSIYQDGPWHMLGNSVLSPVLHSPYAFPPAQNVSLVTIGSPRISMNANLFADGFAQFGWFGVIGVGFLLVVLLRFLDRVAVEVPVAVSAMTVVMPAVTLSNTSLLTSLFSHGFVAAMLLLSVVPAGEWSPRHKRSERSAGVVAARIVNCSPDPRLGGVPSS